MKRIFNPVSIVAMAVCLVVFVYAFSYPLVLRFTLTYLPFDCVRHVYEFYGPAYAIARRCPPYLAILHWEARMLGFGVPANSSPASSP